MRCPSRTDVPRLCHALTAKATPSWAHGGATSSALCTTNRCKAGSIAVERGRNRSPLRLLSSCRPVKMIMAWGGGCHALSCKWPDNLHAFAWQFACNYRAIQLQLLDNLVAIASQFAAIAQITCVTKARNNVFMLVHTGVDGRTPDGGFLVGKRLFDVFNAFG